ncbi:MAG: hypothetical protein KatS3mg097_638 [Candidatus Parcubacteria bacterium]|nr:MAG: hypothetical protein KatS3mg097_638 [Candidatus Parcubacteria bacterium]
MVPIEYETLIVFLSTSIIFIFVLIFNAIFKKKICAVCASVFLTWLIFLVLYYFGYFQNLLVLALLIGSSASGIFNLLKEKLNIFKLPFILTLLTIAYFLLLKQIDIALLIFNLILWLLFALIFLFSKNQNLKSIFQKLIECCKDW